MKVRICLCIVCGIPGSGKSSYCDRLNQALSDQFFIVNVNYDKILLSSDTDKIELHHKLREYQDKAEDSPFKAARCQVLKLVEHVIQNLKSNDGRVNLGSLDGLDNVDEDVKRCFLSSWQKGFCSNPDGVLILIDDNMHLSSMRYEFYQLARQYETGFCEIYMDSSVESALKRDSKRQGQDFVGQDIIKKMTSKMECPNPVKNHWEMNSMQLTTEESTNIVVPMLQEAFANPVQPFHQIDEEEQMQSRTACSRSLIHQVDLILRKCVSIAITNGKKGGSDIRLLSRQAMAVKEDILNSMKSGDVKFPINEPSTSEDASKDEDCDLYKYIFQLFNEKLKV